MSSTTPPPRSSGASSGTGKSRVKHGGGVHFGPTINVSRTTTTTTGGGGSTGAGGSGGGRSHFLLGEPEFNSAEDVRTYCNHVRAMALQMAIELAMAAKILEARLGQAQTLPGDNPIQGKLRARKVGRKLKKAGDGATAVAKGAVAAFGAFTREYADLMSARPARPMSTNPFKF